jgi:hypothetical protein
MKAACSVMTAMVVRFKKVWSRASSIADVGFCNLVPFGFAERRTKLAEASLGFLANFLQ